MKYIKFFFKDWLKCRDNIFVSVERSSEPHSGTPKEVKNVINNETLYTIYVPEIDTLKNLVSKHNCNKKWTDTPAFQRTRLLHRWIYLMLIGIPNSYKFCFRLAMEIEKNCDIFAQLEMTVRGILAKETKMKIVPLLSQYFYFYSGFSVKYSIENFKFNPSGT